MTNKEAIERLQRCKRNLELGIVIGVVTEEGADERIEAYNLAIKALEKDKCSSCKHYDKDYGETCLNPEGTCRVFEYDGYEEAENEEI